ncbi:MAG: hypothetical protein AB7D06_00015 [Pedobacter sp.]
MKNILFLMDKLDWGIVLILCATLGLAPFSPPHIVEKLSMLRRGVLIKPLDWFDLFLHGFPWILLLFKIIAVSINKR